MGALGGPSPIATNGQITVPKHVLEAMGWAPRDQVMLRQSADDPEVLTIVPLAVFERRYEQGESVERLVRLTANPKEVRADQQP